MRATLFHRVLLIQLGLFAIHSSALATAANTPSSAKAPQSAATTPASAGASTSAEVELRKRLDELKEALQGLGDTMTERTGEGATQIKADLKTELDAITARLGETREQLGQKSKETEDQVRKDLGKLLQDLGNSLNTVGSRMETSANQPPGKQSRNTLQNAPEKPTASPAPKK